MTGCPLLDNEFASRQNGKRLPCERLAEENERLQAARDLYLEMVGFVKAENAKLRELVRDIADHIKHDDGFGIDRGWVLDRMRELGVEV